MSVGGVARLATPISNQTAQAIWNALQMEAPANRCGDEIYFAVQLELPEDEAREVVSVGDVAYWPPGRAIWMLGEFDPAEQVFGPAVFRPSWCLTRQEMPDIAIAFSADGLRVDPAGVWPRTWQPYVGLRCAALTDAGAELKKYLTDHPLATTLTNPPMRKGSTWPLYRYIKPDKLWWKYLSAWRSAIVRDVAEVARAYDAAIEAAVTTIAHR